MVCERVGPGPCEFSRYEYPLLDVHGESYCRAHAPPGTPQRFTSAELAQEITRASADGVAAFHSITFEPKPDGPYEFSPPQERLSGISFNGCKFLDGCQFDLRRGLMVFTEAEFIGHAQLAATSVCKFRVQGTARADFEISVSYPDGTTIDLSGSTFWGQLRVTTVSRNANNGQPLPSLRMDRRVFFRAPRFQGKEFNQHTSIANTDFRKSATTSDDEGTYRALRKKIGENRARDIEGLAYALEKRCHRQKLFDDGRIFESSVSWLYDKTAEYGQSYTRPLLCLLFLQVFFVVLYSVWSERIVTVGIDTQAVAFTLAQVARPFEVLSIKQQLPTDFYRSTDIFWPLATIIHSVSSLTLIALTLLALRWRFRRE
jgi:hypothetical protein